MFFWFELGEGQIEEYFLRHALSSCRAFHTLGDVMTDIWMQQVEEQQPSVVSVSARSKRDDLRSCETERRWQPSRERLFAVLKGWRNFRYKNVPSLKIRAALDLIRRLQGEVRRVQTTLRDVSHRREWDRC